MKSWLRQHRFALFDALERLRRQPGSFLFNVVTIAIALSLPLAGLTILDSIRTGSQELAVDPEMSLFLLPDTPRERAIALEGKIRNLLDKENASARLSFVTKESAFKLLKERGGASLALATLGSNPLPDAYVIQLAGGDQTVNATRVETLAQQMQGLPDVEFVQIDSAWIQRLAALLQLLRLGLMVAASALALAVIAVAFNTIRLQVMNLKDEIEVSRLLGATDTFVYRPFYYSGALLGLCAGLVAWGTVSLSLRPLNTAIADFARLYASEFKIGMLPWEALVIFLAFAAVLGMLGAVLSVRQHLPQVR